MNAFIDIKNVAKFDGMNFQAWKFQMRAILIANDILTIVEGSEKKTGKSSTEEGIDTT